MDVTRERISRILELTEILLSFQTGFSFVNAAVARAILKSKHRCLNLFQLPVTKRDSRACIARVRQSEACTTVIFTGATPSKAWLGLLFSALKRQKLANFPMAEPKPLKI